MAKSSWTHWGILVCLAVAALGSDSVPVGYPALDVFRLQATSVMIPSYPSSSLAQHHSGTAVAELLVSPQGKVAEVKILEAPDAAIGASVFEAVGKWTFLPLLTDDNVSHPMKGRLIFYFKIVKGKPVVVDAIAEKIFAATGKRVSP